MCYKTDELPGHCTAIHDFCSEAGIKVLKTIIERKKYNSG